ncbi:MAG: alpha-L-rhamnosidase, partial [Frankiales bacterium]|nr:alpha-L-rhamnosidase [Frankiales bacterium]
MTLRTRAGRRLGITDPAPALSWTLPEPATGYQVQCALDAAFASPIADTGECTGTPPWVPWPADPLVSRQCVHWRVRLKTADGWGPWRQDWVEAGLLSDADWLGAPLGVDDDSCAPLLSREFSLPSAPVRARLYATAYGLHDSRLNGSAVSDHLLEPGWTTYETWLPYSTYDVTDLLQAGVNELTALLGNGWWRGRVVTLHRSEPYGPSLAYLAQLEVECADGSVHCLHTSDGGWTAVRTTTTDDLYVGSAVSLTSSSIPVEPVALERPCASLLAPCAPPVRQTSTLPVVSLGGGLYDVGQNVVGWLRVRVRCEAPCEVVLRHAEVLLDGVLATGPLRSAQATDRWQLPAGEHELTPTFTFHGFRYAQVETTAEVLSVVAVVVGSDLTPTADFACSSEALERLHENTVWSMRGNFL